MINVKGLKMAKFFNPFVVGAGPRLAKRKLGYIE